MATQTTKTNFKITARWSERVIFEGEYESRRHCILDAVAKKINLSGSDLSGSDLRGVPLIKNIHQSVYAAAAKDGALNMGDWHSCETTHCRAGWVVHLAGEAGAAMEFCMGTPAAAALIYLKSDPKIGKMPNFYTSNEVALADMKRLAELEAEGK